MAVWNWRKMRRLIERCSVLLLGFVVVAFGLSLMFRSTLGMGAWGAFQIGLAQISGLSVGRATQIVSLGTLLLAWLLGVRPTMASFLNMVTIGLVMDMFLERIPVVNDLFLQILLFGAGLLCFTLGIAIYLKAELGSGPRESLMLGIHEKFDISIRSSRIAMDGTMLVISILLRGPVGVGTVVHTFGCGPLIQFFMTFLSTY